MPRNTAQLSSDPQDFRVKVLSASRYHFLLRPLRLLLYAICPVIIGRFLSPADYGRVAVALSVVGFVDVFSLPGVNSYLLRFPIAERDSSFFWLAIGARLGTFGLLFLLAPEVEKGLGISGISVYLRFLSIMMILARIGYIPNILLTRKLRYGAILFNSLTTEILAIAALVVCFLCGLKEWSVLTRTTITALLPGLLAFGFTGWRPRFRFAWSDVKGIFPFSRNMFVTSMSERWLSSLDAILIGKLFGSAFAGLFVMAWKMSSISLQNIVGPADGLFLSLVSRLETGREKVERLYFSFSQTVIFVTFPIMILISFGSPYASLFLGAHWKEIYPLIPYLTFSAAIYGLLPPSSVYVLMDATSLQSKLALLRSGLGIGSMLLGAHWGQWGALAGMAAGTLGGVLLELGIMFKRLGLSKVHFLEKTFSLLCANLLLAAFVFSLRCYFSSEVSFQTLGRDIVLAMVGICLYLGYFSSRKHPSMMFVQQFFFVRNK